ncbi:ABC transporter substrate-binding protein [Mycolicibacterium austroafricanum]|uniref:ABC transporter substrate-binding protein n=1 Tax=Mycolicibacterium austroafricanum TaxID=39687 RepID=UPI001CA36748|nr:ABC transporter substrate-binding protein [Mycolicibacterium austroafricanum]QZT64266.1 ABC transporter substrate-binding protein [Mycolicibacterium austroafricanum]
MKSTRVAALVMAGAVALGGTACSGGTSGSTAAGGSSTVIRTPIIADPPPLDPDVYYQPDGLLIMTAAYEGLLRYANESTELEGLLATDWKVSEDGRTYTFTLRDGVTFADGTPFDSTAAKASFRRRIDMAAGPSYMLADVVDMQTPDPQTFVVTLGRPVAAFLHYLASPYGPLMTSPTAVSEHETGGDRASAWLASHTAGTGPYELTSVAPSSKYTLTANTNYWGEVPQITTVEIPVIADPAVQRLQLDNGQLDMVLHGLTKSDYDALSQGANTEVVHQKALVKALILVNPDSAVFSSPEARAALNEALDRDALTENVFGAQATPSTQYYPNGMLPDGAVPDQPALDPAKLAAIGAKGGNVVVGYQAGDNTVRTLTNQIQVVLQNAGLTATIRDIPASQMFGLGEQPEQRPDLLVTLFNPDAAHPDTWSRIYQYTDAPVNLMDCSVPEADKLLDAGSEEPDPAKSNELYVAAAKEYQKSLCWVNIADVYETVAARKGYSNWQHQPAWMWDTNFASLKIESQG